MHQYSVHSDVFLSSWHHFFLLWLVNRNDIDINSSKHSMPVQFEQDSKLKPPTCYSWALPLCYDNILMISHTQQYLTSQFNSQINYNRFIPEKKTLAYLFSRLWELSDFFLQFISTCSKHLNSTDDAVPIFSCHALVALQFRQQFLGEKKWMVINYGKAKVTCLLHCQNPDWGYGGLWDSFNQLLSWPDLFTDMLYA